MGVTVCISQYAKTASELSHAQSEIERLRSLVRFQDGVIRSGDVACLTQGERRALQEAADAYEHDNDDPDCARIETAIRGLLERIPVTEPMLEKNRA